MTEPGRARLLEGGPIADEIRTAVAEDVASFRADARPAAGPARRHRRQGRAIDGLPRTDPARLREGRHRRRFRRARGRGDRGQRRPSTVRELNDDPTIDGVIVQMPLPPTIRLRAVIDAIDPAKDIDGIHPAQRRLAATRLRRVPAGDRPRRRRDPASLRHRDRRPRRGRRRPIGRRRHAGRVPARQGGRDGHRLPLADPRPRRPCPPRRHRGRRRRSTRDSSPARCSSRAPSSWTSASTSSTATSSATSTSPRRSTVASAITPVPGRRRPAHERDPADPPDPGRRAPGRRVALAPTSAPDPVPSGGDR